MFRIVCILLSAIYVDGEIISGDSVNVSENRVLTVEDSSTGGKTIFNADSWDTAKSDVEEPINNATLLIQPEPKGISAPWMLMSSATVVKEGVGETTIDPVPLGLFTVLWGEVIGYETPAAKNVEIFSGDHSAVIGQYVESPQPPQEPTKSMGTNFGDYADYSCEFPTYDLMHLSRKWVSAGTGSSDPWTDGRELNLSENGELLSLASDQLARMCFQFGGDNYPWYTGDFLFTFEGDFDITYKFCTAESLGEGRVKVTVPAPGRFAFFITRVNTSDPPRNFHVWVPGHWEEEGFNTEYLAELSKYSTIRYAPSAGVNSMKAYEVSDLAGKDFISWTWDEKGGMPYYWQIQLANALNCNLWICLPEMGSDALFEYVANLVKDNLKAGLIAYFEYSNETWNPQYSSFAYCRDKGLLEGMSTNNYEANRLYYAKRAGEMAVICKNILGSRCITVLGTQNANSWVSDRMCRYFTEQNKAVPFDTLAIAPYFGIDLAVVDGADNKAKEAYIADNWSEADVAAECRRYMAENLTQWLTGQKKVADTYGLTLIAYEGGQHLAAITADGKNNTKLLALLTSVNASEEMGVLYKEYFALVDQYVTDGVFVHFKFLGPWTKYGSWGVDQYIGENNPKYQALQEIMGF